MSEDEWFSNPLDSMPLATDPKKTFDWEDTAPSEYEPPDDERYSSRHQSSPDFEKGAEEIVTMHEKMYRMATAKYNPFAIGGSESIQDFQGGSENVQDK